MRKVVRWFRALPHSVQLLLSSLCTAIPFYIAALLSHWVSTAAEFPGSVMLGFHAVAFVVLFTVVVFLARLWRFYLEEERRESEEQNTTLADAYPQSDRATVKALDRVEDTTLSADTMATQFIAAVRDIRNMVDAAYQTLEAAYGKACLADARIDFEVTFMAKSYEDGFITIPAAANREGRRPRSLVLREENPRILEDTVTAELHRDPRPTIRIISDTSEPGANYKETYSDQKDRINSSIIYPVLSCSNRLLGTLVAHCDSPGFFIRDKKKFWCDFMEIFAKRIALTKMKLDKLVEFQDRGGSLNGVNIEKPF